MKRITFLLFTFTSLLPSSAQELRSDIDLSDPFIMADARSQQYYMTGTGGGLWQSGDLEVWTYLGFPLQFNEAAWMGASPQVWASEIHCIDGKYYNFSTRQHHHRQQRTSTTRRTHHEQHTAPRQVLAHQRG